VAATPGHSAQPSGRASISRAHLHVRWDRVSVLLALVGVLATVVVHTVVVAVNDSLRAVAAKPLSPKPLSPIHVVDQLPNTQHECPPPAIGVVHTAPPVRDAADPSARTVALTFDDGPGPWTPHVLDVLQQAGVHATFFVIGQQVPIEPEMLRRAIASGNVLGNHTWSHPIPSAKAGWNSSRLASEIDKTRRAILAAVGLEPCLFRPPGGIVKGAYHLAHNDGLSVILWSVDTRDWAGPPSGGQKFAAAIRKRAAQGLTQEHPVILLHDGGGNREATVAALPGIIEDYKAHGYRFVTLDAPT
jgi:peptidoglycan/xylan/chitin deacetylase (PgdA/CDA1 family)